MKAESLSSSRNSRQQAFYAYRRKASPSPSVCSSASSSAVSTGHNSASSRSSITRNIIAQKKRALSYQGSSSSTSTAHNYSYVSSASSAYFNSSSATNASTAASSVMGSAAILDAHAQALKSELDKRRDSLPSSSTGSNKEFDALIEREYQEEILTYMAEMEEQTGASVELIDQQPELAWYMRPYLIDFLVEIHSQYRLRPETLHLAVNIADRYTSKRIVYKRHYQLVGCAALWVAAKFEDAKDRVPTVQDLCAMTCNAYDASAFIQMEGHVLSTLNWLIGHPTSEAWLRAASISDPTLMTDSKLQHVARFLMEITLFHRAFVPLKSSEVALGCLLLARYILGKPRKHSDESPVIIQIAQMLDGHLAEHLEQVSAIVVKKYSLPAYANASGCVREWYLSGRRFHILSWPISVSSIVSASLSAASCHSLRRDSSASSGFLSSFSSSPRSYGCGSSSDDEDAPLTPSTPLTAYGMEDDEGQPGQRISPLYQLDQQHARKITSVTAAEVEQQQRQESEKMERAAGPASMSKQQEKELTPPSSTKLQVKLVPTSGPPMTLC